MSHGTTQLHTAVRRYCMDRYSHWMRTYETLAASGRNRSGFGYTPEALSTYPRYNVLSAILHEVERLQPESFRTLDEARRSLKRAAMEAESVFTRPPNQHLEREVMSEEREQVAKFIEGLSVQDLLTVEPLYHRRVISSEESDVIWAELRRVWGVTERYWYPLAKSWREDVVAFQDAYFEREVGKEKLQSILLARDVELLWEMREDNVNYEIELSVLEPSYNLNEGYWCDAKFDWLIYASHESSITVGGWLLAEVKQIWPNWEQRVWTTPFFN